MKLKGAVGTKKALKPAGNEFLALGDHPALDFINTEVRIDGALVDLLQTDEDVLRWLAKAGWPVGKIAEKYQQDDLLELARTLREAIRGAVQNRKAGEPISGIMNLFLYDAHSHLQLISDNKGGLRLKRQWNAKTLKEVLGPLTESAAELLVNGDLSMIKHCEDSECVLWFYDRTRSHRRRWCNMATCGTRNKVAAFRQRER
ncbi:MAG: ABATE domain-containing protein [Edaphobacter sp.]